MDGTGKTMALVTDTFSDHVVSETADTKGTPAVSDVVYREKHRTVREFSVWSDAQRHIAFPDQSFLSHEF